MHDAREPDFLNAVLDTVGALVVVLDRRGRIVRFNRACEELTGYVSGEVQGRTFYEFLLLPDEEQAVRATFAELRAGHFPNRHENHWLTRKGGRRLIQWTNTALLDGAGEVEFVIGTGIDVTDARAGEDALRQSEARYRAAAKALAAKVSEGEEDLRASEALGRAVLDSLPSQIAVVDRDGVVIETNPEWDRECCCSKACATRRTGKGVNYLEACRLRPDGSTTTAAEPLQGIVSVLRGERDGFDYEYVCSERATQRWYQMTVVPCRRPDGGAVIAHTDITERRRAQLEAQQQREELAHVARVNAMGEVAASLAHEINQPLTASLTNAQTALRFLEGDGTDLAEVREVLQDIAGDCRRAGEVIRRLRTLLRRGEMDLHPVNLDAVVREATALLRSDAAIKGVTVEVVPAGEPLSVWADRVQLMQVVINLMMNGFEAVRDLPGGRRTVRIATRRSGEEEAHLAVQDSGPGIPAGEEDRIFDPFFSTKPSGMGMGLSICRSLVVAHGGRLWAENGPHGGATLIATLPLHDPPTPGNAG